MKKPEMTAPDYALRLKEERERASLSPVEVATAAGIDHNAYYDLETSTDLTNACSLGDVLRVCHVLRCEPHKLFAVQSLGRVSPVSLEVMAEAIVRYCNRRGYSVTAFGHDVGWDVMDVVASPMKALETWNVDCLRDVCDRIGVDWFGVLDGLTLPSLSSPKP